MAQSDGLKIFDITDPANPYLKGTSGELETSGVTVSGHYAYVADADSGLQVVNIQMYK